MQMDKAAVAVAPGLWVVATPIGNLDDISGRAVQVLTEADRVAAEDTRVSARLLAHFGLKKKMQPLHEHNEAQVIPHIVKYLQAGETVALISDAGTPLISDPGYRLVRAVQEAGVEVYPVPGPCALITALSVSGLATDRFQFEGFLPAKPTARRQRLKTLSDYPHTMVFYESAHRIADTLADMAAAFGSVRELCFCRELTKRFETVRRGEFAEIIDWVKADTNQLKGEMVLVVAGSPKTTASEVPAAARELFTVLREEIPPGRAARIVADAFHCSRRALYQGEHSD